MNRHFTPEAQNQLWVADMTGYPTAGGKVYLAAVIDAFSSEAIGWSMGEHPTADLTVEAVKMSV